MEYKILESLEDFEKKTKANLVSLVYFSHERCNVCKVLKPKLFDAVNERYPEVAFFYADTEKTPEISGQNTIFSVPVVIVYIDGKEFIRKSRNISISELENELERPYNMLFT